jgi:hypothetical protein
MARIWKWIGAVGVTLMFSMVALANSQEAVAKSPETVAKSPETVAKSPETVHRQLMNCLETAGSTILVKVIQAGFLKDAALIFACYGGLDQVACDTMSDNMAENCSNYKMGD